MNAAPQPPESLPMPAAASGVSQPPAIAIVPPPAAPAPPLVNPNISANLRADYDALQNDLQQANELASEFQKQLAGKSNEFAHLKQIFEKSREDLTHLQTAITALREERHRLANEAMKATALQLKLNNVTAERDRIRVEMEVIRAALMKATEEAARASCQRDIEMTQLTMEVATLKEALADARHRLVQRGASPGPSRPPKAASTERVEARPQPQGDDDFINISFSS